MRRRGEVAEECGGTCRRLQELAGNQLREELIETHRNPQEPTELLKLEEETRRRKELKVELEVYKMIHTDRLAARQSGALGKAVESDAALLANRNFIDIQKLERETPRSKYIEIHRNSRRYHGAPGAQHSNARFN